MGCGVSSSNFKAIMTKPLHYKARGINSGGFSSDYHVRSVKGTQYFLKHKSKRTVDGGRRIKVEDKDVPWDSDWPTYTPMFYEDQCHGLYYESGECIENPATWSDCPIEQIEGFNNENAIEKKTGKPINRASHEGIYKFDSRGYPLNPRGRTGIAGRGLLGRWGPNHAADPIVMRRNPNDKKKIQFVGVLRIDTNEWAIPGGMVEPGDSVSVTLIKEFAEEAASGIEDTKTTENKSIVEEKVNEMKTIFRCLEKRDIYKGVVDDPRNTDNAWMETIAMLFVVPPSSRLYNYELKAGDDAKAVQWIDYSDDIKLYASHAEFVKKAVDVFKAEF